MLRTVQQALCCHGNRCLSNFAPAQRIIGHEKNLWVEYSALAIKHKAVNLGQGFPDFTPPQFLKEVWSDAVNVPSAHWYTRGQGYPRLVNALSDMYSPEFGRQIDPMSEIMTSVGAYESLYAAITAFTDPGDEVILIEPHFDSYSVVVEVCGGKPVYVPLKPEGDPTSANNWVLDKAEFEGAFTSKTKLLMVNTPHNPIGKLFSEEEMEFIARTCEKHNVIIVSDEVYERCVFPGHQHHRIANAPGGWERTVTVGSAGKSFSMTGYKLGWAIGPEELISKLQTVHQTAVYSAPTILQEVIARCVEREIELKGQDESYHSQLSKIMEKGCSEIMSACRDAGLSVVEPFGGYFILVDTSPLGLEFDTSQVAYDIQCAQWLTEHKKLAGIPLSLFFGKNKHLSEKYLRLCFAKSEQTLKIGGDIIRDIVAK